MSAKSPRMTGPTLKVLRAFLQQPHLHLSGVEIAKSTGLASGTLYPILFRLEESGWLESEWEAADPVLLKRPRRRLYRMTGVGEVCGRESYMDIAPGMVLEVAR